MWLDNSWRVQGKSENILASVVIQVWSFVVSFYSGLNMPLWPGASGWISYIQSRGEKPKFANELQFYAVIRRWEFLEYYIHICSDQPANLEWMYVWWEYRDTYIHRRWRLRRLPKIMGEICRKLIWMGSLFRKQRMVGG